MRVYNMRKAGEMLTQGKKRELYFRRSHHEKDVGAMVDSRDKVSELHEGDLHLLYDGGRARLANSLAKMPAQRRSIRMMFLEWSEESMAQRPERVDKAHLLDVMERVHLVTRDPIQIEGRQRLVFAGTTRGNHLGPIAQEDWHNKDVTWTLPLKVKKSVFGKDAILLPGGPGPDTGAEKGDDEVSLK